MTGQRSSVLVVEDDEEMLNVLSRTLAGEGYDVVWARNGVDALKQLTRFDGSLALAIIDVVLPGMRAVDLSKRVAQEHPGAGVLYISAFDGDTVRSHGVDPDSTDFLPKPHEPSELLRVVRAALGLGE